MNASVFWLATAAYSLHILEEYLLDWRDWARNALGLPVDWDIFYLVNAAAVVIGVCCAASARELPAFALSLPALMLINATFFHVLPFVRMRGRFSPGLFTAVLLFYPIGLWAYWDASRHDVLDAVTLGISLLLGAGLMASPIILLKIRGLPYFQQS